MSRTHSTSPDADGDPEAMAAIYRRLAEIDPPALRSLASELKRLSDESSASVAVQAGPAAQARARRDVQRFDAAQAALATLATERTSKATS